MTPKRIQVYIERDEQVEQEGWAKGCACVCECPRVCVCVCMGWGGGVRASSAVGFAPCWGHANCHGPTRVVLQGQA
jgi:hypothetical protein